MAKYGVWMLERLLLQFSRTDGSSRGMRAFVTEMVPQLRASNPQLTVQEQARPGHPFLVAFYRNGRSKPVCVKNLEPKAIQQHVYWLRNSHGRGQDEQVVTKRQLSRNPSIQGVWNGSTFAAELKAENRRRQRMKPVLQR